MTEPVVSSDLPIPPGEYLEEVLAELGMSKDELAKRMDRPSPKLSAIFKGDKAITPETALQLEKVVGVPAHVWTGLENEYRLAQARQCVQSELDELEKQVPLVKKFCYVQLVGLGFCMAKQHDTEKVVELQRFLGVTSLENVPHVSRYEAAFRCALRPKGQSPEATAAWLRMGEVKAREIACKPFSSNTLHGLLPALKELTRDVSAHMPNRVRDLLARAGVCFVLIPHFPGTYAQGATFWLGRERAVLLATIRYAWADVFWFSLFHEIGHLLLHAKQDVILECGSQDVTARQREVQADRFAADALISPDAYRAFAHAGDISQKAIERFARHLGVHPGIVVGRLQHEGRLRTSWLNDLRVRYSWTTDPKATPHRWAAV